ncbi:MAG: lipopolysaccharide biosynthesis protein [Paludibacter sp.]|nr:lipopolysaccharide biosynthesis protein [Paludibacter sp.]MDD4198260.1 lipopolysaccharide biosynthesis protein [Paludibacter sp.]MDD4428038.1 lipopolysaccharide biosynthesis protein [Paludibacter sp.]
MLGAMTWSSVNIFGMQLVQLIIGIILARILMPEDFGLIGILYVFFGLSTVLIDGGFGQGLIKKPNADNKDFSTVFFLNIFLSFVLYTILYFSAPYIALFFSQPDIVSLSRIAFLTVLIFPLYQTQQIQLLKNLNYKTLAKVNIISVSLSGIVATILAATGYGVWALVYQQLLFHFFRFFFFTINIRWKPLLTFKFSTIRELSGFSLPLLGQFILNVIFNQIYIVIIGRFYPIRQVGYFSQANKYSETVNAATQNILAMGTFPSFAKIQDDKERLLRVYRTLITSVSMITFPLVIFLIVAAEPIIITLISEKWLPSVVLLQLLLLANLFNPQYTINVNILNARGTSKTTLRLEIIKKALILISVLVCFHFGIKAMLIGFIVANFLAYLLSMVAIKKSLNHYYRHQVADLIKTLAISLLTGGATWFFNYISTAIILKLAVQGITFVLLYLIAIKIFFPKKLESIVREIKDSRENTEKRES